MKGWGSYQNRGQVVDLGLFRARGIQRLDFFPQSANRSLLQTLQDVAALTLEAVPQACVVSPGGFPCDLGEVLLLKVLLVVSQEPVYLGADTPDLCPELCHE